MSQQHDILSGKDISALSSIEQEDIMQMVNQAEPLDNIGFVIVGDTRPDITNNPRFIRYLWIDISDPDNPSFKRYTGDRAVLLDSDASWQAIGVESLSILTSMFAARSANGGVNVGLIKLNADFSATPASAYYVLSVDATGKFVEAVNINTLVTNAGGLSLAALQTTGLVQGKFLGYNGGVAGYVSIVPSTDLIGVSRIAIETNIVPGTARYVVRTNAAGTALEFVTPNDLFADGELAVARLLAAGAVANDILRYDGAAWAKVTPSLRLIAGDVANAGILSASNVATQVHTIPHLLGSVPKLVDVRLRMTNAVADIGYNQNDEVPFSGYRASSGNVISSWCADATNITVLFGATTGELPNKASGALAGVDETKWFPIVYAWR